MSLHDALGGMRNLQQWFTWRLEWNAAEAKYGKTPCRLDGGVARIDASLPANWTSYSEASNAAAMLNALPACADGSLRYALGFWLTAECGYWFFDLDKCAENGVLSEFAAGMVAGFGDALCEWSSSRKGIHLIGRCAGAIGAHRSRDVHKLNMEFYTEGRGIAFGLDGVASGSADSLHDAAVAQLVQLYFPPRVAGDVGARGEWRGPLDDDALIERMLRARPSADSVFGGKPTLRRLWEGDCELNSSSDMALASHLAFWTGCDEERMERLMRRSGLVRAKWDEHRTYLRELTIANACAGCTNVYVEPERSLVTQQVMYGAVPIQVQVAGASHLSITPETTARLKELMALVSACGTVEDMHNEIIPTLRAAGMPSVYGEQLVRAVNAKLEFLGGKLPVGKLRALISPPVIAGGPGNEPPEWMQMHCYVKDGDFFYCVANGARMTLQGFQAEYSRLMPMRENGGRENPVEWAFTRWNVATVHGLEYRPDMGHYFSQDGLDYANLYNPASVPVAASAYSEAGVEGIEAFKATLWDMCGRREPVYQALLAWLAHNVQRPGRKIRWSPCMKGVPGDAKTIISNVLRSAMGHRNVSVTGNSTLRNSGGFNDWAVSGAVNFIEEVHLVGKERHSLYNATKEFITNDVVDINAKGRRNYKARNITNHWANTNHNDALPMEANDRRWLIVFTPWSSVEGMWAYAGLTEDEWLLRIKRVDRLWREHGTEARAWFLSLPLDGFDPDGRAMMTPEKKQMMASSQDDAEGIAEGIISEGNLHGVGKLVLSSNCLSHGLKVRSQLEGFDVPRSTALNHMLTRLGFSKIDHQVKWKNSTHTIWVKNGVNLDNEGIRLELDRTVN